MSHRDLSSSIPTEILLASKASGLLDTAPDPAFERLTRLTAKLLSARGALITLIDKDRQFFKSVCGMGEAWEGLRETPLAYSLCQHVVCNNSPLILCDATVDKVFRDHPAVSELDVVAYLGIPLSLDGQPFGCLCAIDSTPRSWSDEDLLLVYDLAQSAMTEIALRMKAQQLEEVNSTLGLLCERQGHAMSMVAHDLRSPITVIMAYSDFLREELPSAGVNDLLESISQSTGFMKRLVDDLLDLESLKSGRLSLRLVKQDMLKAVLQSVALNRELAKGRKIKIQFATRLDLCLCEFDCDKLQQAMNNLLGNAMKYCPPGSRIDVLLERTEGETLITVQDQGPGIEDSLLPNLFLPFLRGEHDVSQSHGLGLAIVEKIMQAHGGRVEVKSKVGEGTSFRLFFPA